MKERTRQVLPIRMIILAPPCQKSMKSVVRLLLQPAIWVCVVLCAAPLSSNLNFHEDSNSERIELEQETAPKYATSPGHTVFGEYVGAHWCPPCMDSASPSLTNLKSSNPGDFTYVSFFESSSSGWPNDSPVNRMDHITASGFRKERARLAPDAPLRGAALGGAPRRTPF